MALQCPSGPIPSDISCDPVNARCVQWVRLNPLRLAPRPAPLASTWELGSRSWGLGTDHWDTTTGGKGAEMSWGPCVVNWEAKGGTLPTWSSWDSLAPGAHYKGGSGTGAGQGRLGTG